MAEKSSFFNSVSGDRRYSAEDWAAYFAAFIGNGVYAAPSNGLQVVPLSGMQISVKAGKGFVNGYFYQLTSDLTKNLSVADGVYSRIDRVVLRWDLLARRMYIQILEGSPGSAPSAPSLTRDAGIYDLALADIRIGQGITEILQSSITDRRVDPTLCGIVTQVIDHIDTSVFVSQLEAALGELEAMIDQAASESLIDNSVSASKIQDGAVSTRWTATIGTSWTGSTAPYTQVITVQGLTAADTPVIGPILSDNYATAEAQLEAYGCCYRMVTGNNRLTILSTEKTTTAVPIQIKAVRK